MGRTLPTFNMWLEHEMAEWAPFRRALRREDQAAFDRLFTLAKRHMAEAAQAARPVPFDALLICILLEQQKELERMHARIREEPPKNEESGTAPAFELLPKFFR